MKNHEKVETLTDGDFSALQLTDEGLIYEIGDTSNEIVLSERSITLARIFLENPNIPLYPKTIKRKAGGVIDSVSDAYGEFIDSCHSSETGADQHFLELGRFSGKSRSFILSTSDEDRIEFAKIAIMDIEFDGGNERKKAKKQKPYYDYIDFIENGPSEEKFTRNRKIAGSLATVISIGAVSWFVLSKRSTLD